VDDFRQGIAKIMHRFRYIPKDPMEQEIDRIISKKIMEHLIEFFKGAKKIKDARLVKTQKRHAEVRTNAKTKTKTMTMKVKNKQVQR
jgi:hypothetical protein